MGIVKSNNKIQSIVNLKCPRCHTGDLFLTPTFSFSKPFDMHKECPLCSQDYEPEPGFYFGAMFISYIFTGFFCLAFTMLLHWVVGWSITASFVALIVVCAVFFVYIFRFARSMWINLNIKYDPQMARMATEKK